MQRSRRRNTRIHRVSFRQEPSRSAQKNQKDCGWDFIRSTVVSFSDHGSIRYLFLSTEKPLIELELSVRNGVVIRAGETLRLPATVTGKPYPSITWTKDDAKPDKDRVEILTEGDDSIVSIKNVQRKDCGKYHISACNPSGTKAAAIRVDVMGE